MCVLMQDNARIQRRDHAIFAQKSCIELQNFRKSGTPRAQKKLRALVDRELCIPHNIAESLPSQNCIQTREKQTSSVGVTQILRPARAKELQSFRKFSARRAQKSCINSASVIARTAELRCSSFSNRYAFSRKITRESSVEITQILRKNLAKNLKKLQNFQKSGTPRAQKIACTRRS